MGLTVSMYSPFTVLRDILYIPSCNAVVFSGGGYYHMELLVNENALAR